MEIFVRVSLVSFIMGLFGIMFCIPTHLLGVSENVTNIIIGVTSGIAILGMFGMVIAIVINEL